MSSFSLIFILCLLATVLLLWLLKIKLPSHFLAAGINARSNHNTPARQIGGLACTPVYVVAFIVAGFTGNLSLRLSASLSIAATLIWVTGYLDDKQGLSVRVRLPAQLLAAIIAVYGLSGNFRLLPELLPHWLETALLCIAVLGSINVANFMDGLDWLTATGIGIPLFLLGIIAVYFLPDPTIALIAFAVSGALAGFAIFNRPPALIFLGDSGSLPLGMITGIAFLLFAQVAGIIPALILPLYYIMDSTSTIILRLRKGENVLQAHSSHAYQVAKRAGRSVYYVTGSIAVLNIVLGIITTTIITLNTAEAHFGGLIIAVALTSGLLLHFRKAI